MQLLLGLRRASTSTHSEFGDGVIDCFLEGRLSKLTVSDFIAAAQTEARSCGGSSCSHYH